MKRIETYATIAKALQAIKSTGKALATVYASNLIASDNEIDCKTIAGHIAEMKQEKVLQYCTKEHPYTFYIAVREHGEEGNTSKSYVIDRCNHLGKPVFTMVLKYAYGKPVQVSFNDCK